ncbi:MAG: hypothetical protein IPO65_06980 [Saprospiraceae bacterium]|nr:hypothetical protein [Saprospiraceae bacterium]
MKANKVLDEAQLMDIDTINNEYYLFSFTDDELMDVIVKKEEWNDFDYVLAQKILKERGKEVSMDILNAIRKQREIELSRHLPYPKTWIITGYTFALFGGLISMMIGVQLIWDKKKLPDGRKMYAYDESARNHGRLIFLIGLMVLILTIYFNMREEFYNEFIR